MSLKPIRPHLRTIHNGSISTVRTQVNIPPGGELTVPDVVAEQLQRDHSAFKDGEAPQSLLDVLATVEEILAPDVAPEASDSSLSAPESDAKPKAAPKAVKSKKG
jgi:hypothetical protein